MAIRIGRFSFEGPYTSTAYLEDRSGVYVILCRPGNDYTPVDAGESATVRTRVETHERQHCWRRNCAGTLTVAVLYTPNFQQPGRMAIEQEIREEFSPACGVR